MKKAICIGINDYPGTESDLAGCVNDAKDWASLLKSYGFSVSMLLDKQVTGSVMREAFNDLVDLSKRGDSLVITYSGHGSFVPDTSGDEWDKNDECLCPYDIVENGPIADDEIHDIFSNLSRGVKCVFISDSCHSGTVTKMMPIVTPPTTNNKVSPQRTVRFLPPSHFLPKKVLRTFVDDARRSPEKWVNPDDQRMLLMAGCQDWEYSYDAYFNGRPNGAFTRAALLALAELSIYNSYKDWFKEIRKILPSRQYPQTPNMMATSTMKRWKVFE